MFYALVMCIALLGGFVQSVTGFGGGIMMMLFLPSLVSVTAAPAYSDFIILPALALMAWQCRKGLRVKKVVLPTLIYLVCSTIAISLAAHAQNLRPLQGAMGVFLLLLAAYLALFSKKIQVAPKPAAAIFCAVISGVTGGLFGIGGPLMAAYFLAAAKSKEEYLANNCLYLVITVLGNCAIRTAGGLITVSMLPAILCGIAASLLGIFLGFAVSARIQPQQMRHCVYLLMAFSGIITLLKSVGIL